MTSDQNVEQETEIRVFFCDETTDIRTYVDSTWGNIEAREQFHKFADMGTDNHTVFGKDKPQHIVKLEMTHVGRIERRDFTCPHTKKEQSA